MPKNKPNSPKNKEYGAKLLAKALQELEATCDEASPRCEGCKDQARRIIDAMLKAWNFNHGKGNNSSGDNIGGYLCWDWSRAFAEAAESVQSDCWEIEEHMVYKRNSRVVHFFIELKVCGSTGNRGVRYMDDGWFDGEMIHRSPWPPASGWTGGTWRPAPGKYGKPPIKGLP